MWVLLEEVRVFEGRLQYWVTERCIFSVCSADKEYSLVAVF